MPKCKHCNKDIQFIKTATGKICPVNTESLSDEELSAISTVIFNPKIHKTHFIDCEGAERFRKIKL